MEAYELVRVFVNKTVVSNMMKRRGNAGYPRLQAVRLLVYTRLKRIGTDKGLIRHLKRNRRAVRALGFKRVPHRTTVGRWWRRCADLLKEVFEMLAKLLQHPLPCRLLVVDSTPLEDRRDPEGRWGYTSRGSFKGFKLHVAVNQEGLPLRALVTPGNRYDSPFLPALIQGLTPSLSKTCLEAMSCGLATIDYRHKTQLSERVALLSDVSNVKEIGEEKRKFVVEHHEVRKVAEKLTKVWKSCLEEN